MITTAAVEHFTAGRLSQSNPDTQKQLDVALAAVRKYCGWHITPCIEQTVTLDGPGGQTLILPTLSVFSINEIIEDGKLVDLTELSWSKRGMVAKRNGARWSDKFGSIQVTFVHGFESAVDVDQIVLGAIDRGVFSDSTVTIVGPFQYGGGSAGKSGLFTDSEQSILDLYRLERPA